MAQTSKTREAHPKKSQGQGAEIAKVTDLLVSFAPRRLKSFQEKIYRKKSLTTKRSEDQTDNSFHKCANEVSSTKNHFPEGTLNYKQTEEQTNYSSAFCHFESAYRKIKDMPSANGLSSAPYDIM